MTQYSKAQNKILFTLNVNILQFKGSKFFGNVFLTTSEQDPRVAYFQKNHFFSF